MLLITPLYAAAIAVLFLGLSFRVIGFRRSNKIGLGDGADKTLLRRMRAHANCAEYAPFALLLMAIVELGGAAAWTLHLIGALLVAGRYLHAFGFGQANEIMQFRVIGMVLTFFSILASLVFIILQSIVTGA